MIQTEKFWQQLEKEAKEQFEQYDPIGVFIGTIWFIFKVMSFWSLYWFGAIVFIVTTYQVFVLVPMSQSISAKFDMMSIFAFIGYSLLVVHLRNLAYADDFLFKYLRKTKKV